LFFNPSQALKSPYFHTSPYPTHPSKLPLPAVGSEVTRILAPELNGQGQKHAMKEKHGGGRKRKKEDGEDEDGEEGGGMKKVARKLNFV